MNYVKNSLIAVAILAIAALTSISANASLLIEPHLGYIVTGGTTLSGTEYKYSGPQYGARLGYQMLGVMGGLAYAHSTYTRKDTTLGATTSNDQKRDDLGLFIGYSAPVMLRAWLGYYFSSKETYNASGSWIKGSVVELGVGFTPLPLVSINLAYKMLSNDKQYSASTGVESAINPKYEPKEIVLGVSVPFTLL